MKKGTNFFKSLRFRILLILLILGIVPSLIATRIILSDYESEALSVNAEAIRKECDILCNLLIKENYLNDSSSEAVNSKLELLSNIYDGRILLIDRDFKVVKDTYNVDEGKTLISPEAIKCFKGETVSISEVQSNMVQMAFAVRSAEVQQIQGVLLMTASYSDIIAEAGDLSQKAFMTL